jgi:uncharacterized protein (DUF3084 family)
MHSVIDMTGGGGQDTGQSDRHHCTQDRPGKAADITMMKTEMAAMKTDQGKLQTDVTTLKTDQGKLMTDVNSVKTEQKKILTDVNSMKTEEKKLQADVNAMKAGTSSGRTQSKNLKTFCHC